MKIKVSEATPVQLDWMVAKCEGAYLPAPYSYSTNWLFGGPLIEREGINTYQMQDGTWQANLDYGMTDELIYWGPTPLIAAMRCFVVSKLGDEVDVPEELT